MQLSDLNGDLVGEMIQVTDEADDVVGETYIEASQLETVPYHLSVFTEPTESEMLEVSITGCHGGQYTLNVPMKRQRQTFDPDETGEDQAHEYVVFSTTFLVSSRRPLKCESYGDSR